MLKLISTVQEDECHLGDQDSFRAVPLQAKKNTEATNRYTRPRGMPDDNISCLQCPEPSIPCDLEIAVAIKRLRARAVIQAFFSAVAHSSYSVACTEFYFSFSKAALMFFSMRFRGEMSVGGGSNC
jgi:hypothetical protein